ncbi:MAG: dipeptidase, partial [Candidatus Bathyarchaeia archaeon]
MDFKIELSKSEEERVMRLHKEALVVDTHSDTLMQLIPQRRMRQRPRKLGERSETGHIDLPRLIEGGVDCQTFGMYTGEMPDYPLALKTALQMVDAFYISAEENKDKFVQVRNYEEIVKADKAGKVGGLLSIEGAEPLMGDLGLLRVFHKLGVRILSFTWNWRTEFADGLSASRTGGKLTQKGLEAMEEMRRLGIVLDVSHITDACFWDVVENTKVPFIASHSNSREVCDVSRNLTDDMLRALAEKGGVTGMNYAPGFIVSREKLKTGYRATVE